MASFEICGGRSLRGDIQIQGSKNAALPILAATILHKGITKLYNCPYILDVFNMIKIMESIGCKIDVREDVIIVDSSEIDTGEVAPEYVASMRSSIILMGSILGRVKEVYIPYPGGCTIGERPIDMHLNAIKTMNVIVDEQEGIVCCKTNQILGSDITLPFPSVGATENVILTAVLAEGVTKIRNAAKEPEIIDLCLFLNKMGAKIHGMGTSFITIYGVKKLKDISYTIISDRIVAGTYLAAAAATYGSIQIFGVWEHDIKAILQALAEMGCGIIIQNKRIKLIAPQILQPIESIYTQPFPGFPTDMQSQLIAALTMAKGRSVMHEEIFEDRFKFIKELKKLGANIFIDNKKAVIEGVSKLKAGTVKAEDLRGGAALIIAGLIAEGDVTVEDSIYVERGYQDICRDLKQLGADIKIKRE